MGIDDKYDAIDKAYPDEGSYLPEELAAFALKCMVPAIVTDALGPSANDSTEMFRWSGRLKR